MLQLIRFVACTVLLTTSVTSAEPPKLLIALSSYRDRPKHPKVYFYEHDGIGDGKVVGSIETVNQRSDYRPSLSHDGRWCAFASELENQVGKIQVWDMKEKKLLDLPKVNDSPNAQMNPSLSGDGRLLTFAAWNRPMVGTRWNVMLYDVPAKQFVETPGLNNSATDQRFPAISGDGRWLAYVTNSRDGVGNSDVFLYDREVKKVLPVPALNSRHLDVEPSMDRAGNLIAFSSDRPGGAGGRDIHLFDRAVEAFLPLPGLNSAAHEQTPSLSPNGRYLVFVSERVSGQGERDVFLYDRQARKLLPTPGLNSRQEDIDPCVIVLP